MPKLRSLPVPESNGGYVCEVARIIIEPSFWELEPFTGQYLALREELEQHGHDVDLREPIERRDLGQALEDVALHIAGNVDAYVEGAVIGAAIKWLRGRAKVGPRRGRGRRAVIYGPGGEVIRKLELPDDT